MSPRLRRRLSHGRAGVRLARRRLYARTLGSPLRHWFLTDLVRETGNFSDVAWLGHPLRQNLLDLWTVQETIAEVRPSLLIETGTYQGGSAMFYAHLFDLLGLGQVMSIDIKQGHGCSHPRVEFVEGGSTSPPIVEMVNERVDGTSGPVMVILDSDHSQAHVEAELDVYGPLVTSGSFVLVQDGVIDELRYFRRGRPGPKPAAEAFLRRNQDFRWDRERNQRFLVTHHPCGWLRRS